MLNDPSNWEVIGVVDDVNQLPRESEVWFSGKVLFIPGVVDQVLWELKKLKK